MSAFGGKADIGLEVPRCLLALSFLIALAVDLHLDRVPQQANADVRP
jgi:hypothetical protein